MLLIFSFTAEIEWRESIDRPNTVSLENVTVGETARVYGVINSSDDWVFLKTVDDEGESITIRRNFTLVSEYGNVSIISSNKTRAFNFSTRNDSFAGYKDGDSIFVVGDVIRENDTIKIDAHHLFDEELDIESIQHLLFFTYAIFSLVCFFLISPLVIEKINVLKSIIRQKSKKGTESKDSPVNCLENKKRIDKIAEEGIVVKNFRESIPRLLILIFTACVCFSLFLVSETQAYFLSFIISVVVPVSFYLYSFMDSAPKKAIVSPNGALLFWETTEPFFSPWNPSTIEILKQFMPLPGPILRIIKEKEEELKFKNLTKMTVNDN